MADASVLSSILLVIVILFVVWRVFLVKDPRGKPTNAAMLLVYMARRMRGRCPEDAILDILLAMRDRPPFDQVSFRQAQKAAEILVRLDNPLFMVSVIGSVDRSDDPALLIESAILEQLVKDMNQTK